MPLNGKKKLDNEFFESFEKSVLEHDLLSPAATDSQTLPTELSDGQGVQPRGPKIWAGLE